MHKNEIKEEKETKYKFTERGRKRESLCAESCLCCEKYYGDSTNSDKLNKISRHRFKYGRPKTPPGFWDVDL